MSMTLENIGLKMTVIICYPQRLFILRGKTPEETRDEILEFMHI